jgi:NAD(P)-dependent dehydrogenase (short-subunit alcohol dehydrogenase family)
MREIRGKRALVTGAASGIGRAIALRLAREGCNLYLLDIDLAGLAETALAAAEHGVEVLTTRCDVSRPEEISASNRAMLARWGSLDILVNNAGVAYYGPTEQMTAQQWDWLLSINLMAPIQFVRELLPVIKSRPESHIVNVASMYGLVAMGHATAYSVSKFGVVGLSESLRAEYGRQGVGISTICPGFVSTNLFRSALCGHASRKTPEPPRLLSTSPEHVAEKIIGAIYHDRRMVVITPAAHFLYTLKRLAPSVIDFFQRLGRRRRIARKAILRKASPELAEVPTLSPQGDAASDDPGPTLIPFRPRLDSEQRAVRKAA